MVLFFSKMFVKSFDTFDGIINVFYIVPITSLKKQSQKTKFGIITNKISDYEKKSKSY